MMNIFAVKEAVVDFVAVEDARYRSLPQDGFVDADEDPPARIKVIGVGGGGSNAVNRMIEDGLSGVEFITVNTDRQDLFNKSRAKIKLQIGSKLTGGRGAGSKPEVGESAAKEDMEELAKLVHGADMVFVTAGMGGGTGTGAAPVIAKLARDQGVLTVGVVTRPFDYEGNTKRKIADEGIKKMRPAVDTLVVIPNQQIFKVADKNTTVSQAYRMADGILRQGVQGITDLIIKTGIVNTDFEDVKTTMEGQGDALMGIGFGVGEDRAQKAAKQAIDNPLLEDTSIDGAKRLLVNISGSSDMKMWEVDEVMEIVRAKADPDVHIIHGVLIEDGLGESLNVTVIATGFGEKTGAVSGKENFSSGKSEMADVISVERFNEMRGGFGKTGPRSGDGYAGNARPRGSVEENLDIPTFIRKGNLDAKEALG